MPRFSFGRWRAATVALLILCCVVLVSCNRADPLPELSADEILLSSAESMRNQLGFHFVIDRDGPLACIDINCTISFGSGEGDYVAPDRARAQVKIIAPGLVTTVGVISVGEVQWETNIMTGAWNELPPNWGFNPATIFDPTIGIQSILVDDTSELIVEDPERIDTGPDQSLYKVTGKVGGDRLYELSNTLIGPDELEFTAWVAPETFELYRVVVLEQPEEGEDEGTEWQIDFLRFNELVEIEPPN